MQPEVVSTLVRALGLAASLFACGVALVPLWDRESQDAAPPSAAPIARLALLPVLALPLLDAAVLAGDWDGLASARMLRLAWLAPQGAQTLACAAGLVMLALGPRRSVPFAATATLPVLAGFALAGHVLDGAPALRLVVVAHAAIAAFWIGGVVRLLAQCRQEDVRILGRSGGAFSRIATPVVPLLPVLGWFLADSQLPELAAWTHTGYGRVVLIKLMFFALLLGLATFNRSWAVPLTRRGEVRGRELLRYSLLAELSLLGLAIACTALLGSGLVEHPGA